MADDILSRVCDAYKRSPEAAEELLPELVAHREDYRYIANKAGKQRKPRGVYGWVMLSDDEYKQLLEAYGSQKVAAAVAYIDESAQITSNKNRWKDWNLVVRKAIREGWGFRNKPGQAPDPDGYNDPDWDRRPH